jgi:hypothetical protein
MENCSLLFVAETQNVLNKFAVPSCKVITVVKGDFNELIVDINITRQKNIK